jgi:hypothetical protein
LVVTVSSSSIEPLDRERHCEPKRRMTPTKRAAVLVRLRSRRVWASTGIESVTALV